MDAYFKCYCLGARKNIFIKTPLYYCGIINHERRNIFRRAERFRYCSKQWDALQSYDMLLCAQYELLHFSYFDSTRFYTVTHVASHRDLLFSDNDIKSPKQRINNIIIIIIITPLLRLLRNSKKL